MTTRQKKKVEDILSQYPVVNDSLEKYTQKIVASIGEESLDDFMFDLMVDSESVNPYGMGKLCLPMVYRYAQRYIQKEVEEVVTGVVEIINGIRARYYENNKSVENFNGIKYQGQEIFSKSDLEVSIECGNSDLEDILTKRIIKIETQKRSGDEKISKSFSYLR